MSMHTENHFNQNKLDRNYKNVFGKSDVSIDFGKSLKSVNTGDMYMFTNFFENKGVRYKFAKKNISSIINNKISLVNEDLFEMKLVNLENDYFLNLKIDEILYLTTGKRIRKMPTLYKFKDKINKELQYYVEKKDTDNFEIKFIDIYHLVIPAPNYDLGETEEHSQKIYEIHKYGDVCLSEIKRELNIGDKEKELVH